MNLVVTSPVGGTVVPLTEVPDPVFADAMVGPGLAVRPDPASGAVVAPIDGTIATLHPHAFVVAAGNGVAGPAVLVHLGIDTVRLRGEGFTSHVVKGDRVRAGQSLITWDQTAISAAGYDTICPVIALDAAADALDEPHDPGPVDRTDPLFTWRT